MFYLDDRNKFGLLSSLVYFIITFISQVDGVINNIRRVTYSFDYKSSPIVVFFILPAIALLIVCALAKDFINERNIITLFEGLFLFIGFLIAPFLRYFMQFAISDFFALVGIIGCILLMSIRLIKSPNMGKIVGFIGVLFIIAYLANFFDAADYFRNLYIRYLWSAVLSVIPSVIFLSYFLFYEKA